MHAPRLRERKRLTDHATHALPKRQVETLHTIGQTATLLAGLMMLTRHHSKVSLVQVRETQQLTIRRGDTLLELAACLRAPISHHHGHYLTALVGKCNPDPRALPFLAYE